ncbi:MAG TPA: DegV family protein [Thermomicrobiales bacterium]
MAANRPVTVVVDSTADIPADLVSSLGITVVPLMVRFGDRTYADGVDLGPDEFLRLLQESSTLPQTSQPPVSAFEEVFRRALDAGNDVVCVTIASQLSGTYNSARLAAEAVDSSRIRLLDSGTVTMQLGWAAIAAARAAQAGLGADEVVAAAQSNLQRSRLFAVLETLEYVYRGGRIGRAAQLVGSMLSIKPILTVENGEVVPLERVRTWRRAIERLVDLTRQEAPLESLAVMHAGNLSDAQAIADRLRDLVPPEQLIFTQAGPVLATYAGPGALGVMPVKAAQ